MKNTLNNAEGSQNPEEQPKLVAGNKPNGKYQIEQAWSYSQTLADFYQLIIMVIAIWAIVPEALADSSIPKPPGLYDGYSMTQLKDGRWLVAGGSAGGRNRISPNEAMLYDPTTGQWTNTGLLTSKRIGHAATLLADGRVLVAGGESGGDNSQLASAEIYDPATGTWSATGSMNATRTGGAALTSLADGRALITGGMADYQTTNAHFHVLATAELYDPKTGKWSMTTPMNEARYGHAAGLLANGQVLVAGGKDSSANWLFSAEIFDPVKSKWTAVGSMPYESRYNYTAALLTNGQISLTVGGADYAWEITNAWEVSKEVYDPATKNFTAVGPHRPHFVSSKNLDRTLTILPESGGSFLASEEIQLMVQSADRFGVTNFQLFCNDVEIGEGGDSPFRFTLTNRPAGTYTFVAKAAFANGLSSTSAPVTYTFKTSEPQVSLAPGPTEFISETHVKTSPATLLASVIGVNSKALTKLTLNGVPQPLQIGNLILHPALTGGKNVFVLVATDDKGRTGKATTEVYLDSTVPTVSIKEPADGASIDTLWVDMHGTFTAQNLKQLTVGHAAANMEIPATINGNAFEARNVFLAPGTNTIIAVAEDMAGNTGTNIITIIGPANVDTASPVFPVQVQIKPGSGFAPLPVAINVQAHVPGKIQKVFYDFNGDNVFDLTNSDLQPVAHTYASGEYFPVVTVQTTVGRFSSLAGMSGMLVAAFGGGNGIAFVNVQAPPVLLSTIKINDPVDLKWTGSSNLYVLSGDAATITEFDAAGKSLRSLKGIGANPSGLDADNDGNVYVAVTGDNQVKKFKPTADSFALDTSFGIGGSIGNEDGGSNSNQFHAPFDVKLANDGKSFAVSDSGNHRIRSFTITGETLPDDGNIGNINTPKGLAHDEIGIYLFIADSGNNCIDLFEGFPIGTSGTNGSALGEFSGMTHLSASKRGLYVADTGNNRVQIFSHVEGGEMHSPVPFNPRIALSSELGLNHPKSVAAVDDLLEENFYIADTGNNRVLLVGLPAETPAKVWRHMIARLKADDIPGAMSDFSMNSKENYQKAYGTLSKEELLSDIKDMENIKVSAIEGDTAEYYFESVIDGKTITFPVKFDKEFGQWKIMEY
jgi:Glucodextranase, domain B/Kelch motif